MPVELSKVFELLGLSTPLLYGAVTFLFFNFLDNNASEAAKAAIREWFKSKQYGAERVGDAIVELFDRIYSRPLLSVRAFGRSCGISIVITLLYLVPLMPIRI